MDGLRIAGEAFNLVFLHLEKGTDLVSIFKSNSNFLSYIDLPIFTNLQLWKSPLM